MEGVGRDGEWGGLTLCVPLRDTDGVGCRKDRGQMTETLVEVKVALERLAGRVDMMEGSRNHKPLVP